MKTMILEQFRPVTHSGSVTEVALMGKGGGFYMPITPRAAGQVMLTKAHSTPPKRFTDLAEYAFSISALKGEKISQKHSISHQGDIHVQ